jgi:hypothetical protein
MPVYAGSPSLRLSALLLIFKLKILPVSNRNTYRLHLRTGWTCIHGPARYDPYWSTRIPSGFHRHVWLGSRASGTGQVVAGRGRASTPVDRKVG